MAEHIPMVGDFLASADVDMIIDALNTRAENFPMEPPEMCLGLILLNIGSRFTPVTCVEGEWMGLKKDIPKGEGIPTCPNGHALTEGTGIRLGWLPNE